MKMIAYVLICAYLFARLDWDVVHYTRTVNREWLGWMHAHEKHYALVTRTAGLIFCTPAMALKPLFYYSFMDVEASAEEQEAISHAPKPSWMGFYNLPVRDKGYVFVSWSAWFVYWIMPSIVWWQVAKRFFLRRT